MNVEYTNLATADLRKLAVDSLQFGEAVAIAVDARIARLWPILRSIRPLHSVLPNGRAFMWSRLFATRTKYFIEYSTIACGFFTSGIRHAGRGLKFANPRERPIR